MSVVYDSSRPEKDETRRAYLVAQLVFRGAFLSAHSQLLLSTWLNKLVLFFSDHEDGTRGGTHDALGCAADAQMPPTRIAMGPDHDKIDVQLLGPFGDLVRGMPRAHRGRE